MKRAQCNIPSLYVAVSLKFPTNSSHLYKLYILRFFILYLKSGFSFLHRQKDKNSRMWLFCACLCTLSGCLWKTNFSFTPSSLGASPLPLHFPKWSLWFLNCFTMTLSCFPPELWSLLTFSEWQSPFVSFYTSVSLNFHQPSSQLGVSDPHSDLISN